MRKLPHLLSESSGDGGAINARPVGLLAGRPWQEGVLIIDDSGDRRSGARTDHVARQCLVTSAPPLEFKELLNWVEGGRLFSLYLPS